MHTPGPATGIEEDVEQLLHEYDGVNLDLAIPPLARDGGAMRRIESIVQHLPTGHD